MAGREHLSRNGDAAKVHHLETEVASLLEELRIQGSRMARANPQPRPQYPAMERMGILKLRAMRGWSKLETARRFFVSGQIWRGGITTQLLISSKTTPKIAP
jgi:hypothetical protein